MRGAAIAGKVGYAASCLLAAVLLVLSGYAHKVDGLVTGLASSNAISGGAQTGAMNILLMGLESRTDYQGNTLSSALLTAMHAGSVYGVNNEGVGGQDTNTLILIHIFAGGQRAVGFSIPRDDWVTFPQPYDGQSQGKIDQAYGLAYAQSLNQTASSSMSRSQRYFLANEAGQKATIDTVETVTNQKIDHFAEVNLAGFFYLAQSFGGVEVCLNSWDGPNGPGTNLHDANSGFNAPHAGYLHLAADQALAFVRERDNLPNGDLDRTHRQQAVLDYVIWKLKTGGVLDRRRPAHRPAQHRRQVPHHRLELEPARLLHPDARAERREPEVLHGAHRGLRRPSTARTPTRSTSPRSRRRSRRSSPPRRRRRAARPPRSRPRRPPRSRPPRPSRSTSTTAAAPAGWPARSRPRWWRRATGPASSATRPRSRRPSRRGMRCSTAREPRPTPPRSPATSA